MPDQKTTPSRDSALRNQTITAPETMENRMVDGQCQIRHPYTANNSLFQSCPQTCSSPTHAQRSTSARGVAFFIATPYCNQWVRQQLHLDKPHYLKLGEMTSSLVMLLMWLIQCYIRALQIGFPARHVCMTFVDEHKSNINLNQVCMSQMKHNINTYLRSLHRKCM